MGALPGGWILQVESARAETQLNGARAYRLDFVGLESSAETATRGEIFVGTGRDEVESIADHWTVGGALGRDLGGLLALQAALEYQKVEREVFDATTRFENIYCSAGLSHAGTGSAGLIAEFSHDLDE